LNAKRLVERQRDAADTRSTRVAATQAGRDRLLEAAPTYLSIIRAHLFEGLGERDVKQLARILGRINATRSDPQ
jgi:DNA-binding MarR family transcriptional regulator